MSGFEKETKPEAAYAVEAFGKGPYMEYRIPGIVATQKGTLILCYEGRMAVHNDWSQIDVVILRSEDEGKNFSKVKVISGGGEEYGEDGYGGTVTWNNPVLIADGELVHLIYHKNYETVYHCVSEDDGMTFSGPVEITDTFREFPYEWNVCASGPGHGIKAKSGRLLVPVWIANGEILDGTGRSKAHNPSTSGVIYSDDRGKSWHAGAMVTGVANANETSIAELPDGRILFNIRNSEPEKCRVLGISEDGTGELTELWKDPELPDPKCFGSMIRIGGERTGFINCANNDLEHQLGKRIYLTFYESSTSGKCWKPSVNVDVYGGYADAAVYGNRLFVFYEQCVWREDLRRVNFLMLKKYAI